MSIEAMGNDFMRKYGSKTVKRKHKKRVRKSFGGSGQGWVNESERHQMASYGIKTGRKEREYTPKTTFKSAPLIKAVVGSAVFGLKAGAGFLAKRREEMARKKAEELEKQRLDMEKERLEAPVRLAQAEDLRRQHLHEERLANYKQAQARAVQNKEEQYAKILEARRKQEQQQGGQ